MTTANGCSSGSTCFSREATPSAAVAEVPKGPAFGPSGRRVGPVSPFAAHLELHASERRGGRATQAHFLAAGLPDAAGGSEARTGDPQVSLRVTGRREDGRDDDGDRPPAASDDATVGRDALIDPMVQVLVALAPPPSVLPPPGRAEPVLPADARTPIEQLMAKLVRRIAWSGNARSGLARLELGAGELAGATLTIEADDGVLKVALDLPPGVDRALWKERISGRLGARGLHVGAVDVA